MPRISDTRPRRFLALATAALAGSAAISGCATTSGTVNSAPAQSASDIGHIHGLGVDPDTGIVFLASHGGMFELSSIDTDEPIPMTELAGPIAGRAQDTMGFTMIDGRMFGSGHPGPDEAETRPANLGLLTSTDSAKSWDSLSLSGEVDFHDIAVARTAAGEFEFYGYSATTGHVMISRDSGSSWASGATLAIRDLTIDPGAGGIVYGTTEGGLMESADGGATFSPMAGAPALYLVESLQDGTGGLIGVDVSGTVWVRTTTDGWRETGSTTGLVEAMTYSSAASGNLVVADDRGISTSEDLGATWRVLATR